MSRGNKKETYESDKEFRALEEGFLKSRRGRPPKPLSTTKLAVEAISKMGTVDYFKRIIDDDVEKELWMLFITASKPMYDELGHPVVLNGVQQREPIELNAISFQAFKLAVAYKRGTPIVHVKDDRNPEDSKPLEIIVIGATPQALDKAARERGLLPTKV